MSDWKAEIAEAAKTDPKVRESQKRLEQAEARLQRAKARAATKGRKLDARRKIILGGALLERARRGGSLDSATAAIMVREIIEGLSRQNDLKAFEGFEL